MTTASSPCESCGKPWCMALRSFTPLCASIRLHPWQSCCGLGQRNVAFAHRYGLGLSRERKPLLLKATLCPFGSRLTPPSDQNRCYRSSENELEIQDWLP